MDARRHHHTGAGPGKHLPQYQSGGLIRARGVEVSIDKTWAADARLRASVSRQNVLQHNGDQPPNSPGWLGKLEYSRPLWAGLRLGAEWQYDGPRRTLAGSELGGWAIANLNFKYHTGFRGLESSLSFLNLFDRRYANPAAAINWQNSLDQDGRTVRLKFDYHH